MSKFTFKGEGRGLTKTLLSLDFEQVHFSGRERDDLEVTYWLYLHSLHCA